jgi:hypothetical protein
MGATLVKNEIYEPKRLDAIYQNLLALHGSGRPQDYEIRVDDFPVVGKNSDPSRFMTYADFITADTRYVSVLLYKNNGQSDKYFFHLQQNKAEQLKGFDNPKQNLLSEGEVKDQVRKELHYEDLLKENAELRKEIEDYEKIFSQMEDKMDTIKKNRDITAEGIVGWLLSGVMKSDYVKDKFPMSDLSGFGQGKEGEQTGSFKRKGQNVQDVHSEEETESREDGISEEDRGYVLFLKDIRRRIGDVELSNVMHLLDLMATNTHSVHYAIKQVTNFLKHKPNSEE